MHLALVGRQHLLLLLHMSIRNNKSNNLPPRSKDTAGDLPPTPPLPRAPVCGGGSDEGDEDASQGHQQEGQQGSDGKNLFHAGESDEVDGRACSELLLV